MTLTRAANAGELTKLRSNGQWANWKLIIDRPNTVYTARATGPVSDYALTYDGGSGTLGDCLAGMTVLIGSTAGAWDHGIARLVMINAGTVYVGPDPSLAAVNDDYITIVNDFLPWGRHAVFTLVDGTVYSDEFTNFRPVPVFTPRAAVIAAGGTVSFSASESWVPGSTISAYSWAFPGASSSTGTTTATPTATYNTSGRFRVALTVTGYGETSIGYGWVYVLGANLAPETGVLVDDPEGETEIGWACQAIAYDRPAIKDRARAVVYSEDYFGNELGSIGPVSGQENIVMAGWIIGETILREPGQDYVEFTIGGPGLVLDKIAMLPSSLVDTSLPTDDGAALPAWSKMASLTVAKGLHYLIVYRSTMSLCMNVVIDDFTWPAHKLTADDDTLWGQLVTFATHGLLQCTGDACGILFIQCDASLYPVADRAADIPVIMALTDNDWEGELSIIRRHAGEAAIFEAEGTMFSGGVLVPVGGRAPGNIPAAVGQVEGVSEVNFPNLATALEKAGLAGGRMNAEYESIQLTHPANNHFIDVAPRQYVAVVVDGETLNCIPRRVSRKRAETGRVTIDLELEPEAEVAPSVSILYPNEGGGEGGEPVEPPPDPPEPPEPPEQPPEEELTGDGIVAVVSTGSDVRTTQDISAAEPTWTSELA